MRGFLAVFERELAERRLLLLLAITGLVPLAIPLISGVAPESASSVRVASAFVLAGLVSGALALLLGVSVIGSELAASRLSFYFSRPLSAASIWWGKIAAALALSFSTSLLVLLPTLLVDGEGRFSAVLGLGGATDLALWAGLVVGAVLLAHAVGVVVRTRSPLLAFDLAGLTAVGGLSWVAGERLLAAGAIGALGVVRLGLAGAAVVALTAAGAAQVAFGRTDRRRAHRFLSLTLWALLLAAAATTELYSRWVVAATPADLTAYDWIVPAPAGSWVAVGGPAARRSGFRPKFLVDTATYRFVPLSRRGGLAPRWSADGRRAAWLADEGRPGGGSVSGAVAVYTADLDGGSAAGEIRAGPSRFSFSAMPHGFALSPDGARVAGLLSGPRSTTLVAADLATGRLLAAAPIEQGQQIFSDVLFVDPSHVRLYREEKAGEPPAWRTRILELDLATGRLAPTGWFAGSLWSSLLEMSADLRVVVVNLPQGGFQLLDARTGERLLAVPDEPRADLAVLLGERYVELLREPRGHRTVAILLRGPDGRELRRLPLPAHPFIRLGGQPDAGHLVYAASGDGRDWTSYLVDLGSGETRRLGRHLCPLEGQGWGQWRPADLFRRGSALVRLDLAHGGEKVLLRPAAAP